MAEAEDARRAKRYTASTDKEDGAHMPADEPRLGRYGCIMPHAHARPLSDEEQSALAHVLGRVRTVTYEGYSSLLEHHALPRIGHLQLSELHPLEVQQLYGQLLADPPAGAGLSAGTVLNFHLVLHQAFAQAVRWQ